MEICSIFLANLSSWTACLDLTPQGIVPQSLWNLILLLNEQNRLKDLRIVNILQRLGKKMGRRLDEKSTELDEDETV